MIRPYLHSTDLRFSHGFNRGRRREHWQEVIETASAREMVDTLETLGFGAILLHRNGYSDHGATLLQFLEQLGRSKVIEDSVDNRICVFLNPRSNPIELDPAAFVRIVPDEDLVRWDPNANASRFWARGDATLRFAASPEKSGAHRFTCQLTTLRARRIAIRHNGNLLIEREIAPEQPVDIDLRLQAVAGGNRIEISAGMEESPSVMTQGIPLTIGIVNMKMRAE